MEHHRDTDQALDGRAGVAASPASAIPRSPAPLRRGPATVLFTDLCGYTALSERLDPEDLRDVMQRLFGGITGIVETYEGHVDKILGDGALVLFGARRAHEDDAVRAIKAALDINVFVETLGDEFAGLIGRPLRMHSSVSTGVLVTSEASEATEDSALGAALNIASRLLPVAGPREIVCTEETYAQTHGYFEFEDLGPQSVKGHTGRLRAFRVMAPRALPATAHRHSGVGVRSRLVGREEELSRLLAAVDALRDGRRGLIAIRGDAGAGKSRLVEELKDSLDLEHVEWLESSARAYSQNTPYDAFTELLALQWGIAQSDSASEVRRKINVGTSALPGAPEGAAECAAVLFGHEYAGATTPDAESWRRQFYALMCALIGTRARHKPTVLYIGDLHWADPSTLELLRYLIASCDAPVLHLVTYRPGVDLFNGAPPAGLHPEEIRLRGLSPSEATEMTASLLETPEVPDSLRRFLQDKAEGNPFYLEELVNSLIETGTLSRDEERWWVNRDLEEAEVPLNVLALIAARLDRLDHPTRTVLAEASVLGRNFPVDVLGRISDDPALESRLDTLQKLDLIRVRTLEPTLEYEFKHAMIQDAAYTGLLRPDRRRLHQRVARELETMHAGRLPEFCETLAVHYRLGGVTDRAVECLIRSAEKCFRRHAVEESYEFYRQAYEMLADVDRSAEEDRTLLEIVHRWGYVIYDQGNMREAESLLRKHEELAESLGETVEHAMYRVIFGTVLNCRERFAEALVNERRGLEMALALGDVHTEACARVWLANTLAEMGQLEESIEHAKRAIPPLGSDPIWITEAHCALGFGYWTRGDAAATHRVAEDLLELARTGPSVRALAAGLWVKGEACLADGDFTTAAECFLQSIEASPEPWPSTHPRVYLSIAYVQLGRFEEAKPYLEHVIELSARRGSELTLTPSVILLGLARCATGELSEGMRMIEEASPWWRQNQAMLRLGTMETILGNVFLSLVDTGSGVRISTVLHNLGFLARHLLTAPAVARDHFDEAIRIWESMGAAGSAGETYLGLARLNRAKKQPEEARQCVLRAIECFEQAGIKTHLRNARELLASMN